MSARIEQTLRDNPSVTPAMLLANPYAKFTAEERIELQELASPKVQKVATAIAVVEPEPVPQSAVDSPMMKAALACVARGWYVFALSERAKEPDSEFSPHGFNSSTNVPNVVRHIWSVKPNANYGIDLGRSNLTVLDFDNGVPPVELNLPTTLQVSTSRGTHVYFAGTVKQGKMKLNGTTVGDIKSGGGYVLGPKCVHPTGAVYSTIVNAPIAAVPSLDALRGVSESQSVDVALDGPRVPRGEHDDTLLKMSRKLRGVMGLGEEKILEHLIELVETRFDNYGSDYKEMCEKHAKSAMKFQPNVDKALALTQQTNLPQSAPTSGATSQTRARKMSSFTKKKIDWLWDARIPFRTLTTVSGDPDQGKSLLTLYIAAQLSKGEPMYGDDEINVPPSDTLLLVAEDDPESTLLPRLEAAGADTDRVHLLESVMLNGKGETIGERLAQLDTDLQNIMDVLNANLNIRLVIIDPISSFLGNTSMNKEQEVRRVLNPLLREAQKRKIAVLLVVHFNKNSETRSAMDRVGGAKALVGLGRAAWTCVSEPKQETEDGEPMPLDGVDRHLFLKLKGNLAPSSLGGLVYALTSRPIEVEAEDGLKVMADTPYVQWIGKTESTAQEVVINGQAKPAGRRFEKVDAVSKWLRGFLDKTNGAAWSADILEAGAARGYSERTLRRYLTEKLHGDIRRVGMETQWVLPGAQLLPHKTVAMPGADAVSDDAIPAEQPEAIPDVIGEAVPTPKKKTRTPRKKRNTVALDVEPETVTSEAAAPLDDLVAPLAGLVEPASQPIMAGDPGAGSEAF